MKREIARSVARQRDAIQTIIVDNCSNVQGGESSRLSDLSGRSDFQSELEIQYYYEHIISTVEETACQIEAIQSKYAMDM
jgi:hypothetical protein